MNKLILLLILIPSFVRAQIMTTSTGNGIGGFYGDSSAALTAELFNPSAINIANGNIYIADRNNNRIRKINYSGIITTIAGNGILGYSGDGGPATSAELYNPMGVATDLAGNTYVTFYFQNYIRKISNTGIITTIAGNPFTGFSGDGGPASDATFNTPWGIATDAHGNIFIADQWNQRIRKINSAGIVTTVAGSGAEGFCGDGGLATSACLYCPNGVAVDAAGNIYIADCFNNRVRKVNSAGIITTIAGNGVAGYSGDGGAATSAELYSPSSVAVDLEGNVYIADFNNYCIRKINTSGIITTVAGTDIYGYSGDGGLAIYAQMATPFCVAVDSAEHVYIADHNNNRIREISNGICLGSTITLVDTTTGGIWSSSNTSIASVISSTGVVTGISAGTVNISYSTGTWDSVIRIQVNQYPNAGTILTPDTLCVASTITLVDTSLGGRWISANANAAISSGNITGLIPGTDSIYYMVTNNCGTIYATKGIQISTIPNAGLISGADSICTGQTIGLTDSLSGGTWLTSNGLAVVNDTNVTGISVGIDVILYVRGNYCGADTSAKSILIKEIKSAGAIIGNDSVCVDGLIYLEDSSTSGTWIASNNHAIESGGLTRGVSMGIDTVYYIIANYCGSDTASKLITINPLPNAGTISGYDSICVGVSLTFSDTVFGGIWSSNNINATVTGDTVTAVFAGVDTISYSVTNLCGTIATNKVVYVNTSPVVAPIFGPSNLCSGTTDTLTDATTGGLWSSSNTTATLLSDIVLGMSAGMDTINYIVTNECGIDTATKFINVNPIPSAGIISGVDTLCPGDTTLLTETIPGGVWSSSNNSIVDVLPLAIVTALSTGIDTIIYTVTADGCTATTEFPLYVRTIANCPNTSINSITSNSDFRIYPNPNQGTFTIKVLSMIDEPALITITNITGAKVLQFSCATNTEREVSLNQMPGLYLLFVKTSKNKYLRKITLLK